MQAKYEKLLKNTNFYHDLKGNSQSLNISTILNAINGNYDYYAPNNSTSLCLWNTYSVLDTVLSPSHSLSLLIRVRIL